MDGRTILLAGWALGACRAGPGAHALAITDGEDDDGDLGVVALVMGEHAQCTGTLVSPRVVLTAAHCLGGGEPVTAFFGAEPGEGGEEIAIVEDRVCPSFDRWILKDDLALLLLEHDAPPQAVPWALLDGPPPDGAAVRLVGFGHTSGAGEGAHRKRRGTGAIARIGARDLVLQPDPSQPCIGDSGGPVFVTIDGAEVLAGVVSSGDPACVVSATAVRADAYAADFVEPYLRETAGAEDEGDAGGCAAVPGGGRGGGALLVAGVLLTSCRSRRRSRHDG